MAEAKQKKSYTIPPWLGQRLERRHVTLNNGGVLTVKLRALHNYNEYLKMKERENNG